MTDHLRRFAVAELFSGVPKCLRCTLIGAATIQVDGQNLVRVTETFEEPHKFAIR